MTKLNVTGLAGLARFERANHGVKDRCLTAWLQPHIKGDRRECQPGVARGETTSAPLSPMRLLSDKRGDLHMRGKRPCAVHAPHGAISWPGVFYIFGPVF